MEVLLTILGGVGCVAMMVAGMWLLPRLARRSRGEVELEGLSEPQALLRVAWAPGDHPSRSADKVVRQRG